MEKLIITISLNQILNYFKKKNDKYVSSFKL